MDLESALKLELFVVECGIAHVAIEREKAEEKLAIGRVEVALAEEEHADAEKVVRKLEEELWSLVEKQESDRENSAELRKKIEDIGCCLVNDAVMIDTVESLIKEHNIVCDFYAEDAEIMEEMKRRGLPCLPLPTEEGDANSGLD